MSDVATRYLYLTRHGEATADETSLTDAGRHQATALAHRLSGVPLASIHHGPLPRAQQTAHMVGAALDHVPLLSCDAAGDFVPYVPRVGERPEDPGRLAQFLAQFTPHELATGATLAQQALDLFTGPAPGSQDRHELVVTHNFLIGWLVREALDAPLSRWLDLVHCNGALTVVRYSPGRPSSLLLYNDMAHLPPELRWTGFPADQRF